MKLLRYLPLAFFSGIHGFALFAPYATVVFALELSMRKYRTAPRTAPVMMNDVEPVIGSAV